MATIAEQLTSLAETKTAIKEAIVAKGVAVAGSDPFSAYPAKIGQIESGGGGAPATKFGVSIDNLLGNVDKNGILDGPTEPFIFDGTGIKQITAQSGLKYRFYKDELIESAIFTDLEKISSAAGNELTNTFYGSGLKTLDMGNLITIESSKSLENTCYNCYGLTNVILTNLREIIGSLSLKSTFRGCSGLTKFYFPSLIHITNTNVMGTGTASYTFQNCLNLTEIHFRADAQAVIESLDGYSSKFGATNASIIFDL